MLAGSQRAARTLSGVPDRLVFATAACAPTFGLELPAGGSVNVIGMQVDAQAGPSAYRTTTVGGVYEGARFGDDTLEIVTTGLHRHACTVKVVYANHL
jgi:hypothetical protein